MTMDTARYLRNLAVLAWIICCVASVAAGRAWSSENNHEGNSDDRTNQKAVDDEGIASICDELFKAHNRIRVESKLPALEMSTKLQAAAVRHAKDMATRGKMTHKGGDGSTPIERIKATGYPYRRAGENVACGQFTVDKLMKGWMNSLHHKQNILGSYSQIGVACAIGENGKRYWCVTFGLSIRR